jgi:hypothetical protein
MLGQFGKGSVIRSGRPRRGEGARRAVSGQGGRRLGRLVLTTSRYLALLWTAFVLLVFASIIDIVGFSSAIREFSVIYLYGLIVSALGGVIAGLAVWVALDIRDGLRVEIMSLIPRLRPARAKPRPEVGRLGSMARRARPTPVSANGNEIESRPGADGAATAESFVGRSEEADRPAGDASGRPGVVVRDGPGRDARRDDNVERPSFRAGLRGAGGFLAPSSCTSLLLVRPRGYPERW